ncbi:MAG TPA: chromosome segregation SMC family protein, partial [Alphaproteobacteria bacterium]|nr:chromosome segregation SMC family protein [Alphaproteobacteria bacterium]
MQITRLRLAGFKSFVEPTELRIEPGMTGVVGPNGCGKSNLVEALRWAMGESAAKRMRAAELEDVIFAGTAARPSRNFAEVALALDNSAGRAPPPYRDQPAIEIVRRLPRGGHSAYRINGRAARARDVQRMLADAATGARSTAIVAQGQIGAFVAAKPTERRGLLEEAAGVAGLYTRRQEAESRLKAAETNLERLEDVLATLASQRQGLEKQARQARRYRKVQEQVQETETQLFALRWHDLQAREQEARAAARAAAERQEDSVRAAAHAAKLQSDAADALPRLRKEEAAAAAAWQRLAVDRDAKEGEAARVADEQKQVAARIASLEADLSREAELAEEAARAIAALREEAASSAREDAEATGEGKRLQTVLAEREAALKTAEAEAEAAAQAFATMAAERKAAERAKEEAGNRLATLEKQLAQVKQDHKAVSASLPSPETIAAAKNAASEARRKRNQAQNALAEIRETERAAEVALKWAEEHRREAEQARLKLATEAETLRNILLGPGNDAPLLRHLRAAPGYETALAAALGDDVAASLNTADPLHWRDGVEADSADPPPGCEALAPFVIAPDALAARLAQVFIAPDATAAIAAAASLGPGQRIVTPEGGLWRWDGYTALAGAPTAGAQRLAQQNRLNAISKDLAEADGVLAQAAEHAKTATAGREQAARKRNEARDALRAAEGELTRGDQAVTHLLQKQELATSRVQALAETLERLQADLTAWRERVEDATASLEKAAAPDTLEATVSTAKAAANDARNAWL